MNFTIEEENANKSSLLDITISKEDTNKSFNMYVCMCIYIFAQPTDS